MIVGVMKFGLWFFRMKALKFIKIIYIKNKSPSSEDRFLFLNQDRFFYR